MANITFVNATLRLKYQIGYDEKNEPQFVTKSYRNLNSTHSTDDLVAVGNAIASLSTLPLASIEKQETTHLS